MHEARAILESYMNHTARITKGAMPRWRCGCAKHMGRASGRLGLAGAPRVRSGRARPALSHRLPHLVRVLEGRLDAHNVVRVARDVILGVLRRRPDAALARSRPPADGPCPNARPPPTRRTEDTVHTFIPLSTSSSTSPFSYAAMQRCRTLGSSTDNMNGRSWLSQPSKACPPVAEGVSLSCDGTVQPHV
jgi:hypothetical protein